jgi:fimbrial chaperone protein
MIQIACRLTLLSVFAAAPWQARSGTFSVNPVRLELAPWQNATALTVSNFGTEPLLVQVRVYRWVHGNNEEVLTEAQGSEAPMITPPLFRLAPNSGSQVIRIGFQKPYAPPTEERQWRVIVEEVPKSANYSSAPAADAGAFPGTSTVPIAVALRLRVSLPLLQRPMTIHQELQWTLERSTDGGLNLTAQNLGSVTERLDEIRLGPAGEKSWHISGPLYLFPSERRSFEVHREAAIASGNLQLHLQGTPLPLMRELVMRAQ